MKTITLSEQDEALYAELAAKTGKADAELTRLAFKLLLQAIEDEEDIRDAKAVLANPGKRYSIEEARAELFGEA